MVEWNHANIEKLIQLYRDKPELWDTYDNNYHIKNKKYDAWMKVASEMGLAVDAAKSKMTSLLSSYRRENGKTRKSIISSKGRGGVYKSKWFAYKFFHFLMVEKKSKNVNAEIIYNVESIDSKSATLISKKLNEDKNVLEPRETSRKLIRKRRLYVSPKNLKIKRNPEDSRLTQAYNVSNVSHDECSTYGDHMAMKLRKFDENQRAILMHKINTVIFEAEMEKYNTQIA